MWMGLNMNKSFLFALPLLLIILIGSSDSRKMVNHDLSIQSLDDFNLVTKKGIIGGAKVAINAIKILSNKIIPKSTILCEPQLIKRNLYSGLSFKNNKSSFTDRWCLVT